MQFENCYIAANCNPTPGAASWGKNNLICYGACNAVMVYDPYLGSGGKVINTLVKHTKRVNSVKWISSKNTSSETELISGSTDSLVIVWSLKEGRYLPSILKGHESNVNVVDGLYREKDRNQAVVVSASMDCSVKVWYRLAVTDEFQLSQNIDLGYNISIGMKLSISPDNILLIACALDNSKINILVEKENDGVDNGAPQFQLSYRICDHEDWVRGIDFTLDGEDILLASCSQDAYIRIWRFTEKFVVENMDDADISEMEPTNRVQLGGKTYYINLVSVLTGHEGWIYSVQWASDSSRLLSASLDKSMIIWGFDKTSELWLEQMRVGEVGGNTLGFYGGIFGKDDNHILAHSYHGAFHIWTYNESVERWEPKVTVGGHFSEVIDCGWEPKGAFLISVSSDQTTRIHAPWPNDKEPVTWHEIARPQVHGYDLSSLAIISRYKFASSAEEKVIRIFEAPNNFVENFKTICRISDDGESGNNIIQGPKGASVPSLGLSNKAIFANDNLIEATAVDKKNPYPEESYFTAIQMTEPPTEETLLQNTLWPEVQKLYGHGYEVYCLSASPNGKYLASACRSTTPEHAAIIIWDTTTWTQIQKLFSHTLTVVQLQFSPDSKNLISVSRDRRWSLFTKGENEQFQLVGTTNKSTGIHKRIIWTCCWSHDSKYFLTGSRDGKTVIWTVNETKKKVGVLGQCEVASDVLEYKNQSVTAAAFASNLVNDSYLAAVGLESGIIRLNKWSPGPEQWREVLVISESFAHHLTVKKLCFRPVFGMAGDKEKNDDVLQLASCSSDHSVRIYNVYL